MRNTPEGTEPGHVGTGLHADPVLRQIISNVQDGILVYGRDLRYLVWNPVMERLSGRTAEEVLGGDARELFPHLKETGILDAIEQVLNGAPPITIDYEYTDTRTGNRLWVSDTCSPLLDERGHIMGVIGTVRDITPYKQLEAELRQSQERFRDLFENAPLGYQSLDEQGNFMELNDTWCRILGYSKEEVMGRNFSEFIHPDFQKVFRENFPKFKALGFVLGVEFEMIRKDGSAILVTFDGKIGRNKDGSFKQTHCVLQEITERRRSEQTLRLMAEILDNAPGSITVHDFKGQFLYANRKTFELHGYAKDEFMGLTLHEVDVPQSQQLIEDRMRLISEYGEASFEVEHFRKDGSSFPLEVFVKLTDWAGEPAMLSIGTDITERKRAGRALRESEERYRGLVTNVNIGIYRNTPGPRGRFIEANPALARIHGCDSLEELLAMDVADLYQNPDDRTAFMEELMSAGVVKARELPLKKKNGEPIWVSCSATVHYDNAGNPLWIDGIIEDITDRKKAELALQEKIEELDRYFTNSLDLLCIANTDGRFLRLNPEWEKVLGYSVKEMLDKPFIEFVHPDDVQNTLDAVSRLNAQKEIMSFENRYRHKDGTYRWIEWRSRPIGKTIYAAARDVTDRINAETERQRLQAQLFQSQKMEAIGHLAGGMAHDFNNMLGVIMSAAEIARQEVGENSPAEEEFEAIREAALRSRDLTMKLLTFARRDRINVKGVDAAKIIGELHGILKRTVPKNIVITVSSPDGIVINCDANQIEQALVNVCNNAVDAMPAGGRLDIRVNSAQCSDFDCYQCGKPMQGAYCLIEIEDSGIGMPPDTLSRITEPFFTTKGIGKGTGLGLSVTLGIVHSHNGHLHLYSEPGKGTSVKIYLPAGETPAASAAASRAAAPLAGTETILVVDDEQALLTLAGKILSRNGYKPILAPGGAQAVEIYEEQGRDIAAVVLDLMMPDMDGAQVSARLKELNPEVKIVFSSGFSSEGVAANLLKEDNRAFVQKPFEIGALCGAIRKLLDQM
jgi:PAS domain S-box-containing protein